MKCIEDILGLEFDKINLLYLDNLGGRVGIEPIQVGRSRIGKNRSIHD